MIKVQNSVATRDPLPAFLQGLAPESLADLSWTDPALGVQDAAWLPEVDNSLALGAYERYGDETLTPNEGFVSVVREVVSWDAEEINADLRLRKEQKWGAIKAERDRRKYLGVKVGQHWFHSDDSSRIQQLALVLMGANIPTGLMWKTLTMTPPPVFVPMTQELAGGIFQATATSDAAIFAAAETHRLAMEASPNPESYDFSSGWPLSIEDEML